MPETYGPLVIGNCSPCCVLTNEEQAVYGLVRYANIAWYMVKPGSGYQPDIFPLDGSFTVPKVVYRGYTVHQEFYPADGSPATTVETVNRLNDLYGNLTSSSGSGINTSGFTLVSGPDEAVEFDSTGQMIKVVTTLNYVEGQLKIVSQLNTPFTFEEAIANAIELLDEVGLLNPDATYNVMYPAVSGGAGDHIEVMHLAYPSEITTRGWTNHQADQYFYVANDTSGNVVIFVDRAPGSGVPAGLPKIPGIKPVASAGQAINGGYAITSDINSSLDGNIWVRKSAVRTTAGYTFRYDYFWGDHDIVGYPSFTKNQGAIQNAFVSGNVPSQKAALDPAWLPGEYIFDPSDVPDYGSSLFHLPITITRTPSAGDTNTGAGDTSDGGAL